MQYLDLTDILNVSFNERKSRNEAYSVRAFARDIGLDHSNLSKIMSGKKEPNDTQFRKIIESILPEKTQRDLVMKAKNAKRFLKESLRPEFKKMEKHQGHFFLTPLHDCVLELMRHPDFQWETSWIAEKLSLKEKTVISLQDDLIKYQIVKKIDGIYRDCSKGFTTNHLGEYATTEAQKNYQKAMANKNTKAIGQFSIDDRDHSSMMTLTSKDKIAGAKIMIREFRRKLGAYLEDVPEEERKDLFALSVGFFPLEGE